jgi:hypothetical protein
VTGGPVSGEHTDVGAYALGLLEPGDRRAFEEHLAGCPTCPAELAKLSGMKDLLSGLGPVEAPAEPGEAEVADLIRRRARAQRGRVRRRSVLAAAAAVALLAGGVGVGLATAPRSGPPSTQLAIAGQRHQATDPATGVTGLVGLVRKPWGTQVTLDLANIKGPLECQMVAVTRSGERRAFVTWFVPPIDFGGPSHPAHLRLEGWTTIKTGDLSRIDVTVLGGPVKVSIPV